MVVSSDSSRIASRSTPAAAPGGEQRVAGLEDLLGGDGVVQQRLLGLLALDLLLEARHGLLEGLQVGEDQLGVDRLDVVAGADLAVDVHDVVVGRRRG